MRASARRRRPRRRIRWCAPGTDRPRAAAAARPARRGRVYDRPFVTSRRRDREARPAGRERMSELVRRMRGARAWKLGLVLAATAVLLPVWGTAQAADTVDVQILGFNDFHGQLEQPTGNVGGQAAGGIEYFASAIKSYRALNPNTVVVSAGDLFGASPILSGLL